VSPADSFIAAIHHQRMIMITFLTMDEGEVVSHLCIPVSYEVKESKFNPGSYFHCLDCNAGFRALRIRSKQVRSVEIRPETFDADLFFGSIVDGKDA